ncbi:MAG: hypothetical protein QOE57_2891 [Acidimicrobiaceae bacterium]|nr:hypothetical protein [Acidimicrobiaceae bacterium]
MPSAVDATLTVGATVVVVDAWPGKVGDPTGAVELVVDSADGAGTAAGFLAVPLLQPVSAKATTVMTMHDRAVGSQTRQRQLRARTPVAGRLS